MGRAYFARVQASSYDETIKEMGESSRKADAS